MKRATDTSRTDEIARVAYAIWEAEGRPDGRDHEHWMDARKVVEEGRAEAEYPVAASDAGSGAQARPVQSGFEDVPPGIVPGMKDDTGRKVQEAGDPAEVGERPGARAGETDEIAGPKSKRSAGPSPVRRKEAGKDYVRPAGRKEMDLAPSSWSKTEEEIDESFPASDPPGNY